MYMEALSNIVEWQNGEIRGIRELELATRMMSHLVWHIKLWCIIISLVQPSTRHCIVGWLCRICYYTCTRDVVDL